MVIVIENKIVFILSLLCYSHIYIYGPLIYINILQNKNKCIANEINKNVFIYLYIAYYMLYYLK